MFESPLPSLLPSACGERSVCGHTSAATYSLRSPQTERDRRDSLLSVICWMKREVKVPSDLMDVIHLRPLALPLALSYCVLDSRIHDQAGVSDLLAKVGVLRFLQRLPRRRWPAVLLQ